MKTNICKKGDIMKIEQMFDAMRIRCQEGFEYIDIKISYDGLLLDIKEIREEKDINNKEILVIECETI